jgi:uncharacterized protein (DUF4415 family)
VARTLADIRASGPKIDRAKIEATTEEDIRRHAAEDESEPAGPLSEFKRRPGQRGPGKRPAKVQVSLRLDPAALDAWKASGPGWQARLGDVVAREAPKVKRRA